MREILIFVHGVSSDQLGRRHDPEYDALYEGVAAAAPQSSAWRTAEVCRIEWGWNHDAAPEPKSENALTLAQSTLGERLLSVVNDAYDPTINPGRYVGVAPGEAVSDEDFKEQLVVLNEELETLNAQARELEQTIAANVAEMLGA